MPQDAEGAFSLHPEGYGPAHILLKHLQELGVVPLSVKVKEGETVPQLLARLKVNPHDVEEGAKDPITSTLVHEMIHGGTANMGHISHQRWPAPILAANTKESAGVHGGLSYGQNYVDDRGLQFMVQDDYMVQTWSFETAPMIQTSGRMPSWAIARFEMPVTVADVISHKGEVYPKDVWDQNVPSLRTLAQQNRLLGRNDHPSSPGEVLGETSLKFQDIGWAPTRRSDGGWELISQGYILNTQAGRDLHTVLESGVPVDVSSRGFGRTSPGTWRGQSAQIVQNFVCKAFDAVIGGASPGAGFARGTLHQDMSEDEDDDKGASKKKRRPNALSIISIGLRTVPMLRMLEK